MKIIFHKTFQKKLKKQANVERVQLQNRLDIFVSDPFNVILNNHALRGAFTGYRSINVSGDLRAIYRIESNDIALFTDIDNHANLYK